MALRDTSPRTAASGKASFRTSVWDPTLILAQIAALQSLHYVAVTFVILLLETFSGEDVALSHVLDYRLYRGDTAFGWTLGLGWITCAGAGILFILYVVERARLCLDFAVTLHFIHLLITSFYSGHVPTTVFWWTLNLTSCCVMSVGGEWICMRREMEPILLSGGNNHRAVPSSTDQPASEGDSENDACINGEAMARVESGGSTTLSRLGGIGKRAVRALGEKKRKHSDGSYEMVPPAEVVVREEISRRSEIAEPGGSDGRRTPRL